MPRSISAFAAVAATRCAPPAPRWAITKVTHFGLAVSLASMALRVSWSVLRISRLLAGPAGDRAELGAADGLAEQRVPLREESFAAENSLRRGATVGADAPNFPWVG